MTNDERPEIEMTLSDYIKRWSSLDAPIREMDSRLEASVDEPFDTQRVKSIMEKVKSLCETSRQANDQDMCPGRANETWRPFRGHNLGSPNLRVEASDATSADDRRSHTMPGTLEGQHSLPRNNSRATRFDRVRGCLLGLAIGDALGAPLEGLSSQQIRAHYPDRVTDFVDGQRAWKKKPYRWRLPGLYSDDTQQALAVTDVLIRHGKVDIDHLAKIYVSLATPEGNYAGAHRGVGRSFRHVLSELKRGVSPRETGQPDSAGIGAAMRIAPVGLFFDDSQIDELHQAVVDASLMTHRDIRSVAGAMVVAHATRRLLDGEGREPSFLLRLAGDVHRAEKRLREELPDTITSLKDHGSSLSRVVANVETLLECDDHGRDRDRVLAMIVEEANKHGAQAGVCKRATMGFPPACIPACLLILLTAESFEDALIEMVNLGGDADSTGAILGALAGAHFGIDAIPTRWLNGLQNREGLETRAMAIAHKSTNGLSIPDLVLTERVLSEAERHSRSLLMESPFGTGKIAL